MTELDPVILAEMTADLVAAYVMENHVRAADLPASIATIHGSLSGMGKAPEGTPEPAKLVPPVSIQKSITDEHIIGLEDGKRYQSMKRHLAGQGLTPAEYRTKWGLPADDPMTAPGYSARRSVDPGSSVR